MRERVSLMMKVEAVFERLKGELAAGPAAPARAPDGSVRRTGPALARSEAERYWLNDYHARVRKELTPLVDAETAVWLADVTRAV